MDWGWTRKRRLERTLYVDNVCVGEKWAESEARGKLVTALLFVVYFVNLEHVAYYLYYYSISGHNPFSSFSTSLSILTLITTTI